MNRIDSDYQLAAISVGLVDSGISPAQRKHLAASADFSAAVNTGANPSAATAEFPHDHLGHGSTLAQVLIDRLPGVQLCVARIFADRLAASASQAADAIDWLVTQQVALINLSFGIPRAHPALAAACQRALEAGVVLVASAPAVGQPVYPASYPGVIRVTGDARCQPGEHSWHPSAQADFGACVRAAHPCVVGASVASAYLSARAAALLSQLPRKVEPVRRRELLRDRLQATAHYQTVQRPFSRLPWRSRLQWDGARA